MFNTSAIMSKVDLKVRVNGIKLFFNKESVRKTDDNYFIKSEYPVCELFDSDAPVMRETVFFVPTEHSVTKDGSLDISTLIENTNGLIVNAIVWHGMYGTLRMSNVEAVDMIK